MNSGEGVETLVYHVPQEKFEGWFAWPSSYRGLIDYQCQRCDLIICQLICAGTSSGSQDVELHRKKVAGL